MKKQLELKEIVGYLPYGLIYMAESAIDSKEPNIDELKSIDTGLKMVNFGWGNSKNIDEIKPILFTISSLTEFRKDLGFVPIDLLEEKYFSSNLVSQCERLIEDERWIYHSDYILIEYFYEWKIDIHNLIEKDLAIEVTKDFNPYK